MNRQNGFTTLEAVVVFVVIGVITVSLAPRFMGVQDDARDSSYTNLKNAFQMAVSVFHGKWLIDGEPQPNLSDGPEGELSDKIYNLQFNNHGYPLIAGGVQSCEDIFENLLTTTGLTSDDYELPTDLEEDYDADMCVYKFIRAPYNLTYSETDGAVDLVHRD
ncbi:hypothetical protein C9I92_24895 [Photobacterium ganghwense]|uniref:hypothetical protein n=1 Tax=Photobacterium ganghwense TaxID=320778 RepID=UPI00069FB737|nr:hypothetical protein [Photobacterium ganghwense]PSU03515.1 hypothetical protein C9I92_24895 [Photobacterium ganghwense]